MTRSTAARRCQSWSRQPRLARGGIGRADLAGGDPAVIVFADARRAAVQRRRSCSSSTTSKPASSARWRCPSPWCRRRCTASDWTAARRGRPGRDAWRRRVRRRTGGAARRLRATRAGLEGGAFLREPFVDGQAGGGHDGFDGRLDRRAPLARAQRRVGGGLDGGSSSRGTGRSRMRCLRREPARACRTAAARKSPSATASMRPSAAPVGAQAFAAADHGDRADTPTRRGTRCVPPAPGMMPSVTSGRPTTAPGLAMRASQPSASSKPPPRAAPCSAATTGLAARFDGGITVGQLRAFRAVGRIRAGRSRRRRSCRRR